MTKSETSWQDAIRALADMERPSASDGERRAADWIAARLSQLGCPAVVEEERAHGGYWWPLGLANLLGVAGAMLALGRRGTLPRLIAALSAGVGATAIWDDVGGGRLWFRRAFLRHRPTWNVIAEAGDPDAEQTVVLVAHHDAAHSGLVFHPALGRIPPRLMPGLHERSSQSMPIMYAVWLGPVLVCAGAALGMSRPVRWGATLALGAIAAMLDIGVSEVVPGANDNLSAVGVLLGVAQALRREPLHGVRVLLVSTGSEESFMEGMQAFGRRHFPQLPPEHTEVVCLECLGGPHLIVLEGEGMLRMRDYPEHMRRSLIDSAEECGVTISRGLRTVAATDALIALRAGYPVGTLASVDYTKLPLNYHWPSDRPEALHWETLKDAVRVCERLLRVRAGRKGLA